MTDKVKLYVLTYKGTTVKVFARSGVEAHSILQYNIKTNPKILSTWSVKCPGKTYRVQANTKKDAIVHVLSKCEQ